MKHAKIHLITKLRDDQEDNVLLLLSTYISPDVVKLSHNKQKHACH